MSSFKVRKDPWLSCKYLTRASVLSPNAWSGTRLAPFWARNAIFHSLSFLNISPGDRVLVPSFICRAAIEPILAFGAKLDFYRVDRNCHVDLEDIRARIVPSTKALLAVHYFGFPQDIDGVQSLCRSHRLSLIEDCAHVLQGHSAGRPLGSFGDVSVFSWRKFLSVYDGADLVLNNVPHQTPIAWDKENWFFTLKVAKNIIEDATGWSMGRSARLVASYLGKIGSREGALAASSLSVTAHADSFDPRLIRWSMSRVSRWVKAHSNVPAIVRSRRDNYGYLEEQLRSVRGANLLHPTLPEDTCPWVLPLMFDRIKDAHLLLRKLGIPAVTWGGVRPTSLNKNNFPDAEYLYDHLVFLPIHQSLTRPDLDLIVKCVRQIGV